MAILLGFTLRPQNFFIHTRSLLSFVRATIFLLVRFLDFSPFLHKEPDFQENLTEIPVSPPASAVLIRELLPVIKFSDQELPHTSSVGSEIEGRRQQESCPVCLYEFESGEDINCLITCNHIFHKSCLDPWLDDDHRTCPVCREHIVPRELRKEFKQRLWDEFIKGEDIYCG